LLSPQPPSLHHLGGNDMNSTLLVLRLVPGLLLIGHGLQKLVPARFSPPLLHANGLRATGAGSEQLGIRLGVGAALLAGLSEVMWRRPLPPGRASPPRAKPILQSSADGWASAQVRPF